MKQSVGCVTFLVREYDEAVSFFAGKLRFRVVEDTAMGEGRRWVVLSPRGSGESRLLLAKAKNPEELAAVGRQAGGRVFLFLHTDDFARDYEEMKKRGVKFAEEPRNEPYGTVAVFEDLYGNKWDLLMPRAPGG
jgi:catechol 2,3-dioxygenase-like lactoylglutathione lyase family enzyme